MNVVNFFADNFWLAATVIAGIVTPIAGFFNEKFNMKKIWKQVTAWALSVVITAGAYIGGFVAVPNPVWLTLPLLGIVVGLASNGIYDIPTIKAWIQHLFGDDLGPVVNNVEEVMICDVAPEPLKVVEDKPLDAEVHGTKQVVDLSVVKEPAKAAPKKKPVNKKPATTKKRPTKKTQE